MICKRGKGLSLQRGIAIFLMALMCWLTVGWSWGSEAFAAESKSAKVSFTKKISYENYFTHDYRVTVNGKKIVAYCIQPLQDRPLANTFTAQKYDTKLMRKVLYYSYGYPGFSSKTKSYLANVSRKSCYKGESGYYVLSHLLLSYAYDGKSSSSDAFHGLSSSSKTMLKKVMAKIESWPDPISAGGISLDKTSVTAAYSKSSGMQETSKIKLKADSRNSISVKVPNGTTLVRTTAKGTTKDYDSDSVKSVTIYGGDSFKFRAPRGKKGTYKSSSMAAAKKGFQPYIIRKDGRQNLLFGMSESNGSVSFRIKWTPTTDIDISTSAADKESGSKEIEADGQVTIADEVSYVGLEAGKEYTLKGKLMDKETGEEVEGLTGTKTFTPKQSTGTAIVEFVVDSNTLAGKSLVAFEDLYLGKELVASHEDINDKEQTVAITEATRTVIPEGETEEPEPEAEEPEEEEPTTDVEEPEEDEPTTEAEELEEEEPEPEAEEPEEEEPEPETEEPEEEPEQEPTSEPVTEPVAEEVTEPVFQDDEPEEEPQIDEVQPETEPTEPVSEIPKTPAKVSDSSPITGDEARVAFAFMAMAAALLAAGCSLVFRKPLR